MVPLENIDQMEFDSSQRDDDDGAFEQLRKSSLLKIYCAVGIRSNVEAPAFD